MVSTVIKVIMIIVSLVLIVSVSLQESRSDGLSGAIGGGAEQLFGKKKSKGYDGLLHKITFAAVVIYFVVALAALFAD